MGHTVHPHLLATVLPVLGTAVRIREVSATEHPLWADYDLASMVEGTFGERLDPAALDAATRRRVREQLGSRWEGETGPPAWGTRYWIALDGERVGTLALYPQVASPFVWLAGLYVVPSGRGRGVAAQALSIAQDAAVVAGFQGIQLETSWAWGKPAALYLRLGFWVRHWKRALLLMRGPRLPPHRLVIERDTARFYLAEDAEPTLTATRDGARLDWVARDDASGPGYPGPIPTFALALALAGFPLLRSPEAWEKSRGEHDVGGPEALARKIIRWEALARRDGEQVLAPRIPGLPYRSWEEICDPPARTLLLERLRALLSVTLERTTHRLDEETEFDAYAHGEGPPILIVAVEAEGSIWSRDMEPTVREFLTVDASAPRVYHWRRGEDGRFRMKGESEGVVALVSVPVTIDVDALYAEIEVDPMPA